MLVTEELLPIRKIQEFPTMHEGVHESIYQCYQVLEHAKIMLMRGDSKETVLGFINHFEAGPVNSFSSSSHE